MGCTCVLPNTYADKDGESAVRRYETLLIAASAALFASNFKGAGAVDLSLIAASLMVRAQSFGLNCDQAQAAPKEDAMTTAADGVSFGPFHLVVSERLLTRGGAP